MNKKDFRKHLRRESTPAETALWYALRAKRFKNNKFRRQHPIQKYIVDFYCAQSKLVIELDGEVHNDPLQEKYDEERTKALESLGYKILRFENQDIWGCIECVLQKILSSMVIIPTKTSTLAQSKNQPNEHNRKEMPTLQRNHQRPLRQEIL